MCETPNCSSVTIVSIALDFEKVSAGLESLVIKENLLKDQCLGADILLAAPSVYKN